MSKSKLYVPLMLRFSLINDQHVEIMKMMEEQIKDDKRSKNQIVMDALEYYFKREADIQGGEQDYVDMATFEGRIASEREKLRTEIYQDIICFLAGSALGGGVKTAAIKPVEQEPESSIGGEQNDCSEFEDNGVRMEDVIKWS